MARQACCRRERALGKAQSAGQDFSVISKHDNDVRFSEPDIVFTRSVNFFSWLVFYRSTSSVTFE
jgi:hypothetical protein